MRRVLVLAFVVALLTACGGHPPTQPARIAFMSTRDGNAEIYVLDDDGSNLVRLTNNPASDFRPACSPDASHIAFESSRDGNVEIYTMNADGSDQTRLTADPSPDFEPSWAPDGRRIAFTSFQIASSPDRDDNPEIYVMNADGSGQTRLTNNPATDAWPTWSPDGSHIAFFSDRGGNPEIYVMDADGSRLTRLTNNQAADGSPAWSPDGHRIVFVSARDGTGQIYIMSGDGSGQTSLTNNPETSNCCPAWSPDGRRIAFLSRPRDYQPGGVGRGESAVYVMDADGSRQTRLTDHDVWEPRLVWSPDSQRIVFESYRDGNLEIYAIHADGSNVIRLTNNPADDGWPAACSSSAPASP